MNGIGIDMKHSMRVVANTPHERSKIDGSLGRAGEGESESGTDAADSADFDSTATRLIEDYLSNQAEGSADTQPHTLDIARLDEVVISNGLSTPETDVKVEPGAAVADGHAARLPDDVLRFVELNDRGSRTNMQSIEQAAVARLLQRQDASPNSASVETSDTPTTTSPLPQAGRQDVRQLAGIAIDRAEPGNTRASIEHPVIRGPQPHILPGTEVVTKGVQVAAIAVQPVGGSGTAQAQIKTNVSARLEGSEATLRSRLGEALLQREGTAAKVVSPIDQSVAQAQQRAGQQSLENDIETSISIELSSRDTLPSNPRANVVNLVANALSKELAGQSDLRLVGFGDAGSLHSVQPLHGATTKPVKTLTIQLTPQHLGQVVAKIAYSGDELRIDLAPEKADTARLLRQDREVLVDMLRASGLTVPEEAVRVTEAVRNDMQFSSSMAGKEDNANALRQEAMESSDRRQRDGEQRTSSRADEHEPPQNSERERRSADQESRRGIYF